MALEVMLVPAASKGWTIIILRVGLGRQFHTAGICFRD